MQEAAKLEAELAGEEGESAEWREHRGFIGRFFSLQGLGFGGLGV